MQNKGLGNTKIQPAIENTAHDHSYKEEARRLPITINLQMGEDLEVTDVFSDGVSFISPRPVIGGKRVDMVICHAIQVEGIVVGCARMPEKSGGYLVRLRFHKTTATFNGLIYNELSRLMEGE